MSNGKISIERLKNDKCSQFLGGCIEEAGTDVVKLDRLKGLERRVRERLPNIQELYLAKLDVAKSKSGKSRSFSETGFDDKSTDTGLKTPRVNSPDKV